MFGFLNDFKVSNLPISVRPPHLLYVSQAKNTFVVEDFGADCVTLAEYLERVNEPDQLNLAGQFMRHLGAWLRAFHEWSLQDGQAGLRESMRISNEESGRFKRDIMYGNMALWCEKVGLLDDETRAVFRRVDELLVREFADGGSRRLTDDWGPSHGDFWTGKYAYISHIQSLLVTIQSCLSADSQRQYPCSISRL